MSSDRKIALLVAALMLSRMPAAASQQSGTTVRHHQVAVEEDTVSPEVQQAEAAIQKQDFHTAQSLLERAVTANPNDYRAWFDLGYVCNATNNQVGAIAAYHNSITAKPDVFEPNLNLGILLAKQGKKEEAAKYLKAATQLTPTANVNEGRARAWQSLGLVEESLDPQQALAAYAQAAKLNPKDAEPHLSAGALLERQDKLEEAAKEYQAASSLDPKNEDAIIGLSNVYANQKKYADAETQLRRLLELEPNDTNARTQLGRVLAAEGKQDEAVSALSAEKTGSIKDPQAALELGTIYVKAGNYTAAEEQLRLAVKGMPNDAEAHFALGSLLMAQKRYPESQLELLTAVKLKPDMGEIYGNLAIVASQNKDYTLAVKALDERAKYISENPATYFLRATSYDNLKNRPKAIENYKQFLAVDGGKLPDQEWQARHRLIAIDPGNAGKYAEKK